MKTKIIILLIIIVVITNSCKRYEDGPWISFRSRTERVVGVYMIEKYYLTGKDILSSFINDTTKYCFIDIRSSGTFHPDIDFYYKSSIIQGSIKIDNENYYHKLTGEWQFNKHSKNEFAIAYLQSQYQFGEVASIAPNNVLFTIIKLTNEEFWLTITNYDGTYEIHLKKRAKDINHIA